MQAALQGRGGRGRGFLLLSGVPEARSPGPRGCPAFWGLKPPSWLTAWLLCTGEQRRVRRSLRGQRRPGLGICSAVEPRAVIVQAALHMVTQSPDAVQLLVQPCPGRVGGGSERTSVGASSRHSMWGLHCGLCHGPCMVNTPVSPQLVIFINPLVVNTFACRDVPNSPGVRVSEPYFCSLPSVLPALGQTMLYVHPSVGGCPCLLGFMNPATPVTSV